MSNVPGMGKNGLGENVTSKFQSGFRPPPAGGFPISPAGNYWKGATFHMPGMDDENPLSPSNILAQFPRLQEMFGGRMTGGGVGASPSIPQHPGTGTGNIPDRLQGIFDKIRERFVGTPFAPFLDKILNAISEHDWSNFSGGGGNALDRLFRG